MNTYTCLFCGSERKSKKSLIGHETFCRENPDGKKTILDAARKSLAKNKVTCTWCDKKYTKSNIKRHEKSCHSNPELIESKSKVCPVCETVFISESVTCSYSCSNTMFRHGREGGLQYATDEQLAKEGRYRDLCFRHHVKRCIVCGEENIVAVHHLNENHDDNRPENLVPLCPTHHQYCHSQYKYMVEEKIQKYLEKWNIGDEEAGSSAAFGTQRAGFDSRVSDQYRGE